MTIGFTIGQTSTRHFSVEVMSEGYRLHFFASRDAALRFAHEQNRRLLGISTYVGIPER